MEAQREAVACMGRLRQAEAGPADAGYALVQAALQGDGTAFSGLVDRYWRRVASVAGRFMTDPNEVEDVLQETFVRAFQGLRAFRGESTVETWLIRIALNICVGRRRGWWHRRVRLESEQPVHREALGPPQPAAESEVLFREWQRTIQCAVGQLPEQQRLPILLHFFEQLSGAEIAHILRCSESTVWSRIYGGMKRLRTTLSPWMEPEGRPMP